MIANGCRFYRDCFTCPFPDCIASDADIVMEVRKSRGKRYDSQERAEIALRAAQLAAKGLTKSRIARVLGVHHTTIKKALQEVIHV